MKTNIIFLDFDGPLTNARAFIAFDAPLGRPMWTTADPVAIAMLNILCERHGALVVLTTTWRRDQDECLLPNPTGLSAIDSLKSWGFTGGFHTDFRTKHFPDHNRNREIIDWLRRNNSTVGNFVSIDDLPLKSFCNPVVVDDREGISSRNYHEAHGFLSGGGYTIEKALEKAPY